MKYFNKRFAVGVRLYEFVGYRFQFNFILSVDKYSIVLNAVVSIHALPLLYHIYIYILYIYLYICIYIYIYNHVCIIIIIKHLFRAIHPG